jgi:protein-tyrosine kinase
VAEIKQSNLASSSDKLGSHGPLPTGHNEMPTSGLIHSMNHLHDHFYKVLWKIVSKKDAIEEGQVASAKGGYAVVFGACHTGDGASTMAYNFAAAFAAHSSKRMILIDGNIRNPFLHRQFHVKNTSGLTDIVLNKSSLENALLEVIPQKFYFLQAGSKADNPVALYECDDFKKVLDQLHQQFDLIIFDSGPFVETPESVVLASATDGLILVLQAEKSRWEVALSVQKDLESAGVSLLGTILNKKPRVIPESIYRLL